MNSLCSLNLSVEDIYTILNTLNTPYTLNCLDNTTPNNTHDVLQASLNKICILEDDLTALELDVQTNYVRVDQIDEYIQDYIDNSGTSTLMSNKMVPYAVYEYHGPLSFFDLSGAGTGDWLKIYLCNGQNGTPDKRGVVSVGATTGMSGGPFNTLVDPALPGNPSYSLGTINGTNTVGITATQMPSHTHTGSTGVAGAHSHTLTFSPGGADADPGADFVKTAVSTTFTTDTAGAHSHTITIDPTGGGQPHPNVQPGMGVYYIQYRP
jgi:microcystin-dependent protein